MNWLDKVKMLRGLKKDRKPGEPRIDICPCESSWLDDELKNLEKKVPWFPSSYKSYITEFDSTSLGWCNFFGSINCDGIPIQKKLDEYLDLLKEDYFPFGQYPDGSIFLFNRKGEVLWWDKYDYEFKKPKYIASSFNEFMEECLLGKRYGEFTIIETSSFYKTLQSQGWA